MRGTVSLVLAGAAAAVVGGFGLRSVSMHAQPSAAAPSHIVTAETASHVDVGGAALEVSPESAILVSGDDEHGVLVVIDRGAVECEVAPRGGRPPFAVQAGDVSVKVVGTHFAVTRVGDAANVRVDRGTVEVTAHGTRELVQAGGIWPPLSAPAPGPASGLGLVRDQQATPEARPAATTSPPAHSPTPRQLYESATELEARHPELALAMYAEVAKGDGPWAANALFAEARLQADLARAAKARPLLEEYMRRFPRGANVEDARRLLGQLP